MEHPAFVKMTALAREPDALEATICYLVDHLSFLREQESVLICFSRKGPDSLGCLFEQAVLRRGAVPLFWEKDLRWKTLLRQAFSSRATVLIGPPLTILGLTKLARANSTPLSVRNVVTASYPCLDWMVRGITRGLDCRIWGCYGPGTGAIVTGFSCAHGFDGHLRESEYAVDIVDGEDRPLPAGEVGELVLYPKRNPAARFKTGERARLETGPCRCGCDSPRLMGISMELDSELVSLGAELLSWTSVLDCRLYRGENGLEMELITFPGEKLPKLPSCARQVIRPWDPETDAPSRYIPGLENLWFYGESH